MIESTNQMNKKHRTVRMMSRMVCSAPGGSVGTKSSAPRLPRPE
jgi:hypothetical protein